MACTFDVTERDEAVRYLMGVMGPEALQKLRRRIVLEGPLLSAATRHGLLAWVAKTLMDAGFGWTLAQRYEVGMNLLEEAAFGDMAPPRGDGRTRARQNGAARV